MVCGLSGAFVSGVSFVKQKTAYDMRISDWSSDVCSSDLHLVVPAKPVLSACKAAEGAGISPFRYRTKGGIPAFAGMTIGAGTTGLGLQQPFPIQISATTG